MKHLPVSLKLTLLVILTTVSTVFGAKNIQAQTSMAQQASRIVPREISVTAKLLNTSQQALFPQKIRLVVIPVSQPPVLAQTGNGGGSGIIWVVLLGGVGVAIALAIISAKELVVIGENEVGIVYKKFALRSSDPSNRRIIALNGEAGYQADTLGPGWYWWRYWSWMYTIRKEPLINVPPGEIALVVAKDGQPIPTERMLGKVVDCNNFQNARKFLEKDGEQGRQLGILTSGRYQINTELFTIITTANATQYGMNLNDLRVYQVDSDKIGIVTTYDGISLPSGEIAAPPIPGHNNFQNGQKFIENKGCRGLQEEVLPTGAWNLNPWFVKVEQVPLTKIDAGTVGVIISHTGKVAIHNTGKEPVEDGYKGIWKTPCYPGKHSINTKVMDVVIVPTHKITLEWSDDTKPPENYDTNLNALKLGTKDGYSFEIEVTQVIRVEPEKAPQMILAVGSVGNDVSELTTANNYSVKKFASIKYLVTRVLAPTVSNYFLNSAQDYNALDFYKKRRSIQNSVIDDIVTALREHGVEAIDTLIHEPHLPSDLIDLLQRKERAKWNADVYGQEVIAEEQRRKLVYEQALTAIQGELVKFQQGVDIARLQALADKYKADADANTTFLLGKAQADIMQAIINVLGRDNYISLEKIKQIADIQLPNVWVSNSNNNGSGSLEALIASMLHPVIQQNPPNQISTTKQESLPAQPSDSTRQDISYSKTTEPRCPVILLLDTSSSMLSEFIHKLSEGLNSFKQQIAADTTASHRVEVTVITFGNSAQIIQEFTTVESFFVPPLIAHGTPALGQGIELALNKLENRKATYANNGIQHYIPWVFLITCGNPTDDWQYPAQRIKQASANGDINFFVVGVKGVNTNTLSQISPQSVTPLMLDGLKFRELFQWLANSLKEVTNTKLGDTANLPPPNEWVSNNGANRYH